MHAPTGLNTAKLDRETEELQRTLSTTYSLKFLADNGVDVY